MPAVEDPIDADQENAFQDVSECWDCRHADLGYGVSWGNLLRFGIAVELADQPVAIFGGALGQIVDEGFDLISAGISQGGGSAVVGGIGLHEASIELVLANQQAEAVAEARLAVLVAVISVRGRLALIG